MQNYDANRHKIIAAFDQFRQPIISVVVGIDLSLVRHEIKASSASVTHLGRLHDTCSKLSSLHEEKDERRKMSGHLIRPILFRWNSTSGEPCSINYKAYTPKQKNKAELKVVLQQIWDDLPKSPSTTPFCRSEAGSWHTSEFMAVTSSTYCSRKYYHNRHHQSGLSRDTTISRKNQSNTSSMLG